MQRVDLGDIRLNARLDGPPDAPPVVLLAGAGLTLAVWDAVVALCPQHRILRIDARGHGGSDVPPAPYAMGALIRDAERVMDHFACRDAVVVGHSTGGLVAQGLAVKRLDLVRALVLPCTAARIGTRTQWDQRCAAVRAGDLATMAENLLRAMYGHRWAAAASVPMIRDMLLSCPPQGWLGTAAAVAGCDLYTQTASLTLPTLGLAGANDGLTPPDLVHETVSLIRGSRFHLMRGAGHLPFVEAPDAFATLLTGFLHDIGHI